MPKANIPIAMLPEEVQKARMAETRKRGLWVNKYPFASVGLATIAVGVLTWDLQVNTPAVVIVFLVTLIFALLTVMNDQCQRIDILSLKVERMKKAEMNKRPQAGAMRQSIINAPYLDTVERTMKKIEQREARRRYLSRIIETHATSHPGSPAPKHAIRELNEIMEDEQTERAQLMPIHQIRIGDAERSEAISLLGDHYAAGRLDQDEFNERMDKASKAKTAVILLELFNDLPKDTA